MRKRSKKGIASSESKQLKKDSVPTGKQTIKDNRSETETQRGLQEEANASKQSIQLQKKKSEMNPTASQEPVQMVGEGTGTDFGNPKHNFKDYARARANPRLRVQQANAQNIAAFSHKFYHKTYKGKAGIVVAIIDRKINPHRADYGQDLMDISVSLMKDEPVGNELSPEQLINTENEFRTKALAAYNQAVRQTDGRTDTQLGLHADHVTYT